MLSAYTLQINFGQIIRILPAIGGRITDILSCYFTIILSHLRAKENMFLVLRRKRKVENAY